MSSPATHPTHHRPLWQWLPTVAWLAAGGLLLLWLLLRIGMVHTWVWELTTGETNNVVSLMLHNRGQALYPDPTTPPFLLFQYTPLFLEPVALVAALFDVQDHRTLVLMGRWLALVYNLALGAAVMWGLVRLGVARLWAAWVALAAVLVLSYHNFSFRPDALTNFTAVATTMAALVAADTPGWRRWLWVGALGALCFFTKQTSLQVPAAIGLWLLLSRRWLPLASFAASFSVVTGLLAAVYTLRFGDLFWVSTIMGVANPWTAENVLRVALHVASAYAPFLVAGLATNVLLFTRLKQPVGSLLAVVLTTMLVVTLLGSAKEGATVNYYDLWLVTSLVAAGWLAHRLRVGLSASRERWLGAALVVALCASLAASLALHTYHRYLGFYHFAEDKALWQQVEADWQHWKNDLGPHDLVVTDLTALRVLALDHLYMPNMEYYWVSPFDMSAARQPQVHLRIRLMALKYRDGAFPELVNLDLEPYLKTDYVDGFTLYERK